MQETVFVDINHYSLASYPSILSSGGLGPCTAIGFMYNTENEKKSGGLAHCFNPFERDNSLTRVLEDLSKIKLSHPELEIYLAGGCRDREGYDYQCDEETRQMKTRNYILRCLRKIRVKDNIIRNEMCNHLFCKEYHGAVLKIDLNEGRALFERLK